jgi:uncharacterized membrane protein AbrB (regulator of aidB expression)
MLAARGFGHTLSAIPIAMRVGAAVLAGILSRAPVVDGFMPILVTRIGMVITGCILSAISVG